MTSILLHLMLAVLGQGRTANGIRGSAPPRVLKVDPPRWWPGHTINPIRLLVRGENLHDAVVDSPRRDVHPEGLRINGRGTSLFVNLTIDPGAVPGDVPLRLQARSGSASILFRLEPPIDPAVFRGAQGITRDDVIYLVMTDRFCNGDRTNDVPAAAPAEATDRLKPRGFHGGDFRGVIDRLAYLQELGVTALWLTPWYDNFNGIYECDKPWCPYTYYHGYHAVDFYGVEDHFGSLDTLRELVAKAHARGLKVIQDQVSNHAGLRHPWVADPPLPNWFHGTPERHEQNPFLGELVSSPHAAKVDRARVLDGWFSDDSPDLNQDEPEVARYLIQNALWWVGMTGIDGIREDTAQYLPRGFLRDLSDSLHRQHPRLTIIGEVMDLDPIQTSFFLGGKVGWDGVDTGLDSVFDFPTWGAAVNAFTGKLPMTELRRALRADALYADPARLTTLTGNHDQRRFLSWPAASPELARLHLAFTLTLRGIPQLYYGDELAMPGGEDPDNRRDFPGGFPGDRSNAFEPSGRTAEQQRMWTWTRDWLALRRAHPALRRGTMVDLHADPNVNVYARRDPTETIVIAFNRAAEPATAPIPAAAIDARAGMQLVPILGTGEATPVTGDRIALRLPPVSAVAYELK
jgi:glycosidase